MASISSSTSAQIALTILSSMMLLLLAMTISLVGDLGVYNLFEPLKLITKIFKGLDLLLSVLLILIPSIDRS